MLPVFIQSSENLYVIHLLAFYETEMVENLDGPGHARRLFTIDLLPVLFLKHVGICSSTFQYVGVQIPVCLELLSVKKELA